MAIRGLRSLIDRVALSDASVLVMGPSGSGKELVARAIHAASRRSGQAFVALNCGAIPADLMESELFGHERGAFTGASARRIGRFEEAHKGTLFLDEIGDMRFDMQVKLLRVLEDGLVQRVGGGAPFASDVRIVSATHQNIETAIAENRFREDLYFRLGVVPIRVPSLAERVEDLPLLIQHFRQKRAGAPIARFDRDAMMRLMAHDWPGNVRELRNVIERADILYAGTSIGADEAIRARPPAIVVVNAEADLLDIDARSEGEEVAGLWLELPATPHVDRLALEPPRVRSANQSLGNQLGGVLLPPRRKLAALGRQDVVQFAGSDDP